MKRRVLAFALSLCLALALISAPLSASAAFNDVSPDDWFAGAVDYVVAHGLMQGTGNGNFTPDKDTSRAMIVTILHNLEGKPAAAAAGFDDVKDSAWYAPGVNWAKAKGVVKGYSDKAFGPNDTITLEQLVLILMQYAELKGYALVPGADLSIYSDAAEVHKWAKEAVAWAVAAGVISAGGGEALKPRSLVSRARTADVLTRFCRNVGVEPPVVETPAPTATPRPTETPKPTATPAPAGDPVTLERQSFSLASGKVNAWVMTVNTRDPRVTVKSAVVNDTLGATADFRDIVAQSGAYAAVNANFFEAYKDFKTPIGHVMTGGVFLQAVSGMSNLGIDQNGGLHMGKEPLFTDLKAADGKQWTAYEINSHEGQFDYNSVLFTPAYGESLLIRYGAWIMTVSGGVIRSYRWADVGEVLPIPADGYLFWMSPAYMAEEWNLSPTVGTAISAPRYRLFNPDWDSFPLEGIVSLISGSPRLIRGGQLCYETDAASADQSRFGDKVAAGRTVAGIGADGRLILCSVDAATIQQLREMMTALGCVEALNLDGGASRAMYCNGSYQCTPGRQLTCTLQIFVK